MNAKESTVFMFKVHLPHVHAILQSYLLSQVTLTNPGGGGTSAGRLVNFDSFSEIGYRSP